MKRRRRQNGFLIIVAVLVVVIIAFIAVTATYQFAGDSLASANHLKSAQAFSLAQSGIAAGKYAVVASGTSCNGYASGNVSLGQGQYSVTGATNLRSTTLSAAITNSATTIPLISTTGFTSSGVISVDSEFIIYSRVSGNSLIGATRGASGSVAATHSSGAAVVQNECILTSTGAVPTIAAPLGKRTLQMVLTGAGFALGGTGSSASGFAIPALVSTASINLSAGRIINPTVTSSSPLYASSTALSSTNVVINNQGATQISSSGGSLVTSSSAGNVQPDVGQNSSLFNSGNLFSKYFTQSQATIKAAADQSYNSANINGAQGKTIWVNGGSGLNIGNGVTIGTPTNPVILILGDGNLNMTGNATIYGFVYINPSFGLAMQGTARIEGAVAMNGPINMNATSPTIALNPSVLSLLNITNSNTTQKYSGDHISLQEVYN